MSTPPLRVNGITLPDGSAGVAISGAGNAVIRYNDTLHQLEASINGGAFAAIGGGGGGTQGGATSASHVPYASGANTLADGELSFNSGTHTYSVASATVLDFSAATASMKCPAGGAQNLVKSSATETVLSTTGNTSIATHTPSTDGQYVVYAYYRVFTGPSDITITATFNDASGSRTVTLATATAQAIGSYTVPPIMVTAKASIALTVLAQAGTANRVVVSASLLRLN